MTNLFSRYEALGIPHPDPDTMCKGQCEGTGLYPVAIYKNPPGKNECRPVDPDPLTPYEIEAWHQAETTHPNEPGDAYHFIRCPDCGGTGKRTLPDLVRHLMRQREFSERTFGPGERTAGVLDHIRKELTEIEAKPDDLSEWIDVIILACDGAWRAGFTPAQIAEALVAKQAKNEARTWPDWRTAELGKAIEHVRDDNEVNEREPCQFTRGGRWCVVHHCYPETCQKLGLGGRSDV
jgi:dATP/dGTP diphosphohydrolase